jgi:hypothetical protein
MAYEAFDKLFKTNLNIYTKQFMFNGEYYKCSNYFPNHYYIDYDYESSDDNYELSDEYELSDDNYENEFIL